MVYFFVDLSGRIRAHQNYIKTENLTPNFDVTIFDVIEAKIDVIEAIIDASYVYSFDFPIFSSIRCRLFIRSIRVVRI